MVQPYWPEPLLPRYRAGSNGHWRCQRTPRMHTPTVGYFLPHPKQDPGWMFKCGDTIWMSLTRMEVESHMMHIANAYGHTVIAGLGMGFALYNIAQHPSVTKVTVLEVDHEVVALLDKVTDWRAWPGHRKVELVMGDARSYIPKEPVDYLYADIWQYIGDYRALPITQDLQKNIAAKTVGFWGQEFDFITWCSERTVALQDITRNHYRRFARDTGLPLAEQDSLAYPYLALLAVTLMSAGSFKGKEEKKSDYRQLIQIAQSLLNLTPVDKLGPVTKLGRLAP